MIGLSLTRPVRTSSRLLTAAGLLAAAALLPLSVAAPASADPKAGKGDSGPAVAHDTSAPLSSYKGAAEPSAGTGSQKKEHFDKRDAGLPQKASDSRSDSALQTSAASTAAPTSTSFEGVGAGLSGFTVNSAPPDTDAAVSPTQIVETVNSGFAVFNKSGGVVYGPVLTNTLFSGFGGSCQTTNDGDAVVRWDRAAGRWIIAQFANAGSTSGPYYECLAISTTSDATGSYYRYSFQYANFPDYPKLGVWPDAYYVTYNTFSGNTFKGAQSCAMDRAKMLTGAAATQQCFNTGTSYGGLLPSDDAGGTGPPAGEPNLHVAIGATASTLAYWKFHVDFTTPANSTFTGPSTLATAAFSQACAGGTCIPQSGTTNKLDSLADRLMYHLSYRNNGGLESLVLNQSVVAGSSTGIRWYELRGPNATPSIFQQGTYAPDTAYRWMGSAAMDKSGGIAIGYSTSSSTTFPSIRYAGRAATDPAGTLTTGEGTLFAGSGSQTGTLHRWGDYASMSIDPADDCTFWFASEYLAASGTFNWHTRIGHFTLPGCGTVAANDFTIASNPTSGTVVQGASTTTTVSTAVASGSAETVSFTASGLPTGATATFAPTSVTAGGSSTLTLATSTSTPTGTYPVTITGTAPSAAHSTSYSLTVTATGGTPAITNGGFETGSLSGWTSSGAASSMSTVAHAGSYAAVTGSSSPTNGLSSIAQTFTAPSGSSSLSFW
ncbi:MAG: hypothetical protein JWO12_3160, partial [Frankiales bacterium]|nr:hypothetical protein [Frankiales bacterium]